MLDEIVQANASDEGEPYTDNGSKSVTHFIGSKPLNHEKANQDSYWYQNNLICPQAAEIALITIITSIYQTKDSYW